MATKTKLKAAFKKGTIKPAPKNDYVKHWSQVKAKKVDK